MNKASLWRDKATGKPSEPRHSSTEIKVRVGFAVSLAFLGVIAIASYLSVARFSQNTSLISRSHSVVKTLDALVESMLDTETAQRAYLITGQESLAPDYPRASGRVEALLQELRNAVDTNPAQLARVQPLADAVRARISRGAELVELRKAGGMQAVQQQWLQSPPPVEALARQMKDAEAQLVDGSERQALAGARTTQQVIVGGVGLAFIFVVLALYAIRRDLAAGTHAEGELNRFFDLTIDLFTIASPDGRFKRMSPAVKDILGYTVEEALALDYMQMQHPDDLARTREVVVRQSSLGERVEHFESRFRHKDGTYRMLSWRSQPHGGLFYATARDVTEATAAADALREAKEQLEARVAERTRELADANQALRKSERRFRALIEHVSDTIVLLDAEWKIAYLSPAVASVEGYLPEELIGRPGYEHTHPDDLPIRQRALDELRANPGKPVSFSWRRRHKQGHWVWLEGVATNLLEDADIGAVVANYRDVSERIQADLRQREQMQRLALMSRITHAIGERQDLGSIFQVVVGNIEDDLPADFCCIGLYDFVENQLTISCVGMRSAPLAAGIHMGENNKMPVDPDCLAKCAQGLVVYESDIRQTQRAFQQRLASVSLRSLVVAPLIVETQVFGALICARRTPDAFSSDEIEFLRHASEHAALAAHQAQLYDALQTAYDELRASQQQVMQQERLRALGQMASGIAHDINNAISPVALYTEALLAYEASLSPRARSQLEIIQRAIDDIAQTVARMGEFYRQREAQQPLSPVDLNSLVGQVIALTRARWSDMAQQRGTAIEVRTELAADLPPVAAVESQIRDALVNLVFNAVDAMPEGGPIIIRTRLDTHDHAQNVRLEVEDKGVGMDEDTRRRCLEPFFTTKGARGTGLGLAMVYGIAQRHGATLEIESEPGRGTLIRMSFSVTSAAAGVASGVHRALPGPRRILIIDDDPMLLKSLRDALETDGHDVTSAGGGQAGIDAFRLANSEGKPFPVVITDLGMPHVDGRKVASTIKASSPATVVIMLTGWGHSLVAEKDIPPGVDVILSKPPRLKELRAALARATGIQERGGTTQAPV